jgi:hypothetical protein
VWIVRRRGGGPAPDQEMGRPGSSRLVVNKLG